MRLRRSDLHGLTGVYALDALAGPELDRFTRHLGGCPGCEHEVRGFRETTTQLALAVAATPPAHFRPRVLAAVAATRQLPPEAPAARPARRPAVLAGLGRLVPAAGHSQYGRAGRGRDSSRGAARHPAVAHPAAA